MITLKLRPHVTFNDGSPAEVTGIATVLKASLLAALGSASEDVESVAASGSDEIAIRLKRPTPFVLESLDVTIRKPGSATTSTAPFKVAAPDGSAKTSPEMIAYERYYLGPPSVGRIVISTYPDIRAAWADMLRNRLDMLYEVGIDALDSMSGASNVRLYTFDRPYQYVVFLNPHSPKLRSAGLRRALNQAIDRTALVRDGLSGHGTPSVGPVSPHHWAFSEPGTTFQYAPGEAAASIAAVAGRRLSLKCLTPAEPPYEHLALVLKQQLQAVGVDLVVDDVTPDNLVPTLAKREFEMLLVDAASGWSLFRPYRWWHSKGTQNAMGFSSPTVDAALDRVRHAASDEEYRAGVTAVQKAIGDDPPAIFLAWGDRARAVASRFDVQAAPGRDVLATLRLWRPTGEKLSARRN